MERGREPILNMPRVVSALLAALVLVHVILQVLPEELNLWTVLAFAFIPARYGPEGTEVLPGGTGAALWSPLTYAFLHGGIAHLAVNALWLTAFGSALAWRFEAARFLAFSAVCTVAGALAHLATHGFALQPVVGASAAISGHMAAVCRFAFESDGPLSFGSRSPDRFRAPARPLRQALAQGRVLAFLGVWFGLNLLFGAGLPLGDGDQEIAWQAHIGGFLAGLFLFPLFDPIGSFDAPAR
jgi:membrane associated rhomboid family serine protease